MLLYSKTSVIDLAGETSTSELYILGRCCRHQVLLEGLPIRIPSWSRHKVSHMGTAKTARTIPGALAYPPNMYS